MNPATACTLDRICLNQGRKIGSMRIRERYCRQSDDLIVPFSKCAISLRSSYLENLQDEVYVVPDGKFLNFYIEILEHIYRRFDELNSKVKFILLNSILDQVYRNCTMKERSKLVEVLRMIDPIIFFDDFSVESLRNLPTRGHTNTSKTKANVSRNSKKLVSFLLHLKHNVRYFERNSNIILVSDDETYFHDSGIQIMSMENFIASSFSSKGQNLVLHLKSELDGRYEQHVAKLEGTAAVVSCDVFTEAKSNDSAPHVFHEGVLQISRYISSEGFVQVRKKGVNDYIFIFGRENMGQAFHGDKVLVEVLPKSCWKVPSSTKKLTSQSFNNDGSGKLETESTSDIEKVPTGRVSRIIEEGKRKYVVTIPMEELSRGTDAGVLGVPMDPRVPKIKLRTHQAPLLMEQRLYVQVDSWDMDNHYPNGHYIKSLGRVGQTDTEVSALLHENDTEFPTFSATALACLPELRTFSERDRSNGGSQPSSAVEREAHVAALHSYEWNVSNEEALRRTDLRKGYRIFSVDPPGCEDIDDAMHVRILPTIPTQNEKREGKILRRMEIGVHIADVTFFVKHDSPLDREARIRGTTVYLPHARFDMLPELLSGNLCSLLGNEDRYAVSVFWDVSQIDDGRGFDSESYVIATNDDETIKARFERTIIKSVAAMTYYQADELVLNGKLRDNGPTVRSGIAGSPVPKEEQQYLSNDLRVLMAFARWLNRSRRRNGALELSKTDFEFKLDPRTKAPIEVVVAEEMEIHKTIAELMILANRTVAEHIHKHFPRHALLRTHAPADTNSVSEFLEFTEKTGISTKSQPTNFQEAIRKSETATNREISSLLKSMATRAMEEAVYVSTGYLNSDTGADSQHHNLSHFGLGIGKYTHFTSPIRRYADIVVHRLLLAAMIDGTSSLPNDERHSKNVSPPHAVLGSTRSNSQRSEGHGVDKALDDSLLDSLLELDIEASPAAACSTRFERTTQAEKIPASKVPSTLRGTNKDEYGDDDAATDALLKLDSVVLLNDNVTCSRSLSVNPEHEAGENSRGSSLTSPPPFAANDLENVCKHLNERNRKAKQLSFAAKELFLKLHFMNKVQGVGAVISKLKSNGFVAYLPDFDVKGAVFLADKNGTVQIDPSLIKVPFEETVPASQGFTYSPSIRGVPQATLMLDEEQKMLSILVNGRTRITFNVLATIQLLVTCDVDLDRARLPNLRFELLKNATDIPKISDGILSTATVEVADIAIFQSIDHQYNGMDLSRESELSAAESRKTERDVASKAIGKGRLSFGFRTEMSAQKNVFECYPDYKEGTEGDRLGEKKEGDKYSFDYDREMSAQREASKRIQREAAKRRHYKKSNN